MPEKRPGAMGHGAGRGRQHSGQKGDPVHGTWTGASPVGPPPFLQPPPASLRPSPAPGPHGGRSWGSGGPEGRFECWLASGSHPTWGLDSAVAPAPLGGWKQLRGSSCLLPVTALVPSAVSLGNACPAAVGSQLGWAAQGGPADPPSRGGGDPGHGPPASRALVSAHGRARRGLLPVPASPDANPRQALSHLLSVTLLGPHPAQWPRALS